MAIDWKNVQRRSIDPYESYHSSIVNFANNMISFNGDGVIYKLNLLDITPDNTSLRIEEGSCLKDSVYIEFDSILLSLSDTSGTWIDNDINAVVIDYEYVKQYPPRIAKIDIIPIPILYNNLDKYIRLGAVNIVNGLYDSIITNLDTYNGNTLNPPLKKQPLLNDFNPTGNISPDINNYYDLGDPTHYYNNLYVNNIHLGDNGTINGNNISFNGNATTASKLKNPVTISLTGDVTGSTSFDGSSNVNINTDIDPAVNSIINSKSSVNPDPNKLVLRNQYGNSFSNYVTATHQLISHETTNPPIVVSSNAMVNNLNANLLQGYTTSQNPTAHSIPVRDSNGNIYGTFIHHNPDFVTHSNNISAIMAEKNGDGFIRRMTIQELSSILQEDGNMTDFIKASNNIRYSKYGPWAGDVGHNRYRDPVTNYRPCFYMTIYMNYTGSIMITYDVWRTCTGVSGSANGSLYSYASSYDEDDRTIQDFTIGGNYYHLPPQAIDEVNAVTLSFTIKCNRYGYIKISHYSTAYFGDILHIKNMRFKFDYGVNYSDILIPKQHDT